MTNLLTSFIDHVNKNNLFTANDRLLLAVSGGVDSVVLCELCHQAGFNFSIAHCNFRLRGEESERDKEFTQGLAEKYKVEIISKDFDTNEYAQKNKLSIQEAARALRYNWFHDLITHPASRIPYLVTAHHADDNAETVLMNFCRGTGLQGLTGIPEKAGYIRRPLLIFSKQQLVAFARDNNLEWVEDSSNLSTKYTRNLFRNEIIPAMEKVYPGIKENLNDNIYRFKEISRLYRLGVDKLLGKMLRVKGEEVHIPVKQLMEFGNKALIYELISPYGFQEKQVEELVKLASAGSGKYIQSPGNSHRVIKHRHWFIIAPVSSKEAEHYILDGIGDWELGIARMGSSGGKFSITQSEKKSLLIPDSTNIAIFDSKKISFPLLVRKWKTGDYFYPLGMKKKKKLSRFFIDLKLSRTEKENAWVLESGNRIIWVIGYRIDDRFKITEKTKEVIKITYSQ